jgi:hypothetical protein
MVIHFWVWPDISARFSGGPVTIISLHPDLGMDTYEDSIWHDLLILPETQGYCICMDIGVVISIMNTCTNANLS